MEEISRPITRADHADKTSGRTQYLADRRMSGALTGMLLRSTIARGKILGIRLPRLPEGYIVADQSDVPGENAVSIVLQDTPVFAKETVEYVGEPILLLWAGRCSATRDNRMTRYQVAYPAPVRYRPTPGQNHRKRSRIFRLCASSA